LANSRESSPSKSSKSEFHEEGDEYNFLRGETAIDDERHNDAAEPRAGTKAAECVAVVAAIDTAAMAPIRLAIDNFMDETERKTIKWAGERRN
jgi:hypothetical protein